MTALLTAIALWLSANFNLPPLSEPPKVELVSPARITTWWSRIADHESA